VLLITVITIINLSYSYCSYVISRGMLPFICS